MKIIGITGTRADYGILRPLLLAMNEDPAIELKLVVTGMHLVPDYGYTLQEIKQDGLPIISTPSTLFAGDSTFAMAQALGVSVLYFSDVFHYHRPDFVLLLGDRGEMLAAAISAHYQNFGIVHLHGGERSGSADDMIRHSITKLSHLHFVASQQAKRVLMQTGEEPWRIVPVGSLRKTEVEQTLRMPAQQKRSLKEKYKLDPARKTLLVAMHPDSKESVPVSRQITEMLLALEDLPSVRIVVIGANSDAGGGVFQRKLKQFTKEHPRATYYPSVPSAHYLFLLSTADVLIGNSSSGIIEAPFFRLPFVNIGNRQSNREQGGNVINVQYDAKSVRKAIQSVLDRSRSLDMFNPYDLTTCPEEEIVTQLKHFIRRKDLLDKKLVIV